MLKSCEVCVEHDLRVRGKRNLPGGSGGGEKGACDGAPAAATAKVGVAKRESQNIKWSRASPKREHFHVAISNMGFNIKHNLVVQHTYKHEYIIQTWQLHSLFLNKIVQMMTLAYISISQHLDVAPWGREF